jgi:hypothetical protein
MPFAKYHVDPAHIEAMRSAFRKICDTLRLNCSAENPATDSIVLKIVEIAKGGEHDPDQPCRLVLLDLATRPSTGG